MYLINPPIVTGNGMEQAQVLEARLTEVLAENERLKSQSVRREVVQVQVPQYIDRPELVEQVDALKKQVTALEGYRLQGINKIVSAPKAVAADPEIRLVEKVVLKSLSIYVTVATGIIGAVIGAVVTKLMLH